MHEKSLWIKIKCFFGFHRWTYTPEYDARGCLCCHRSESVAVDDFLGMAYWEKDK